MEIVNIDGPAERLKQAEANATKFLSEALFNATTFQRYRPRRFVTQLER
jgi:hypothetical protein